MKKIFTILVSLILISSCTDNSMARKFGGTETIQLEKNEKLLTVTWKETNLWILVEDTATGICTFKEKSSFGIMQGKIIFHK